MRETANTSKSKVGKKEAEDDGGARRENLDDDDDDDEEQEEISLLALVEHSMTRLT